VDYTKAFDCVDHVKLWNALKEMNIPAHLIRVIKNLYNGQKAAVRIEQSLSGWFEIEKGVRQGCLLSPGLFNLYGEYIMRRVLKEWSEGFKIGSKRVNNLRYADDTAIIATNENDLMLLMNKLEEESEKCGLRVNQNKTKIMIIDRDQDEGRTVIPNIDTVRNFKYLGAIINNKGTCDEEIRSRCGQARSAMSSLEKIWKDKAITRQTKIRLTRTLVFSIATYGCETWSLTKTDRKRIDAFEMWCWRRLLRVPWTAKRTNESILNEIKPEKRLTGVVEDRILRFFGHMARKRTTEIGSEILFGKTDGSRRRGKPRGRWLDQIKTLTGNTLETNRGIAQDRRTWRDFVNVVTSLQ
jgi:hypothetical protein